MKILFSLFEMLDLGGIVQDVELKAQGLREAGHEVSMVIIRPYSTTPPGMRKLQGEPHPGSYKSVFSTKKNIVWAQVMKGWFGIPAMSIGNAERIEEWKDFAAQFDLIIHEIPGPGKPDKEGLWMEFYNVGVPSILSVHDANFRDAYPHLIHVAHNFAGVSCTNPAGYRALEWMPAPRAFIPPPHPQQDWDSLPKWEERRPYAVVAHVWKLWKRHHLMLKALEFQQQSKTIFLGDGIEGRYMRSVDKPKARYIGLWDASMATGNMKWLGTQPVEVVFDYYHRTRVMLDMSYSRKLANFGCHFNRSIFEAGSCGSVGLCVTENMDESYFQKRMFKAGYTHFEVSKDATPQEVGEAIDHVANLSAKEAAHYVHNIRKVFSRYCDYRTSSLEYLKLAEGKAAGLYPILEVGESNEAIEKAAEMKINDVNPTTIRAFVRNSMGLTDEEEDDGA